jgi:hypothetical protein
MRGGKYLAEDRGAFDESQSPTHSPIETQAVAPARAPVYELAAHHDGQPSATWLRFFMQRWNAEQD